AVPGDGPQPGGRGGRARAGHLPRLARGSAAAARTRAAVAHRGGGPGRARPARRPRQRRRSPVIAFVSGRVAAAGPDGAVIDVHGVGLSVQCTPATLAGLRVGDEAHVPTSLVVREDSLTLFGFADIGRASCRASG